MREAAVVSQPNPLQRIPGVAIVLVLLVTLFSVIAPGFLSVANLSNVLVQSTILTMLALPMTLIIMTEGLDLSMGAVLTLTSLCVAIVSLATKSMLLGLGAGLLVGAAFGVANGWLVAILGIPPFVATLGTLGMAQGLSLIVSDGQSVVGIPHGVRDIYSATAARHSRADRDGSRDLRGVPRPALSHPLRHLHFRTRRQSRGAALCRPLAEPSADRGLRDRWRHGGHRGPVDDRADEFRPPHRRPRT
ncbi:xanthosine utilization system XapX-like protein [Bradyrhizobium ottawaense]